VLGRLAAGRLVAGRDVAGRDVAGRLDDAGRGGGFGAALARQIEQVTGWRPWMHSSSSTAAG
jgi:hypothetical protein